MKKLKLLLLLLIFLQSSNNLLMAKDYNTIYDFDFIDIDGNYTLIQGDVKVIRIIEGQNQWNEYKEYHFDKDFSKTLK